jgi:hypothetical protein
MTREGTIAEVSTCSYKANLAFVGADLGVSPKLGAHAGAPLEQSPVSFFYERNLAQRIATNEKYDSLGGAQNDNAVPKEFLKEVSVATPTTRSARRGLRR